MVWVWTTIKSFLIIFIVFYMFLHDTSNSNNFVIWSFDCYLYPLFYNDFGPSANLWYKWYGRMEGIHAMVYYKSLGLLRRNLTKAGLSDQLKVHGQPIGANWIWVVRTPSLSGPYTFIPSDRSLLTWRKILKISLKTLVKFFGPQWHGAVV